MTPLSRQQESKYRFLCDLVKAGPPGEGLGMYRDIGDDVAWDTANSNDVASIVGHRLSDALGPENVPERWHQAHRETHARISAYLEELDRLAAILAEKDIPVAALKNGGIARGIHPCVGCCPMGDLDVLVEKRHFRNAHLILLNQGYHFEFRSPLEEADLQAAEDGGGAEYWKMLPGGDKLWLELQWRPVAGRWIRPDQEPSAEELLARSIPIQGTTVRLLSPEDNLLQVCLHTAKHSYVRAPGFRLNLDVDRIVDRHQVDWERFTARVLATQVRTAVYFSLAIPKFLFQTPIPDGVLTALRPPRWRERLLAKQLAGAGLFNPMERKFNNSGYLLFTALLYDDFRGLCRAIIPNRSWMRERYGFHNAMLLPVYHLRRLANLAVRRTL